MILNADFTGLEWRVAMHYSQDKIGMQEILDGVKIHDVNKEYFGFPEKVHAKVFI
jgi:DNA polymerase I-like protein with 3'-5' exonuclease and polymerase domains